MRDEDTQTEFSVALQHIAREELADREQEIEEVIIRLERHETIGNHVCGELIRMQTDNLPPQAASGHPVQPLGVSAIGHSTVFAYDPRLSVLALQLGASYSLLPAPTMEAWQKLNSGRVRSVGFRVAHPESLRAVDAQARAVKSGLVDLKGALGTTKVDVTLSMSRGDEDIGKRASLDLFRWFRAEKEEERGGISRLTANVVPAGLEKADLLNLIEAQMGAHATLELPSDDPDQSYAARVAFTRRVLRDHRRAIEAQNE